MHPALERLAALHQRLNSDNITKFATFKHQAEILASIPALIAALVEIESITHGNEWLQLKIQEIIATHLEPLK